MKKIAEQRKILFICILFVLTGALSASNARMGAMQLKSVDLFGREIGVSSVQGVLQALISLMCIVMVCLEYKLGRLMACIGLGISMGAMLLNIIVRHQLSILPGLIFSMVTVLSLLIIASQIERMEKASITDDITGLKNRHGFMKDATSRIARKNLGYLAFVQLKDFRNINDNLGHSYGDKALKIVADRIVEAVGNNGTVCRLDGTEYAVSLSAGVDVESICNSIVESANKRITLEQNDAEVNFYVNTYVGVATYGTDSADIDQLMKYADIAMYDAMHDTKKRVCFFTRELEGEALRRDEIQRITKDSLENDYFYLVYQPQYVTENHELRGFETLLRCKLPDGTIIAPSEFIPIAEKSELIVDIDEYVMRRAMHEFADVVMRSPKHFMISVNVSAKSMSGVGFAEKVRKILEETGFPAERLEIEITEYSFAKSHEQTFLNVIDLRDMGIKVALDDFGTGYTSLSQLLKLPITLVKIDKTLIDDIVDSRVNRDFVDSVIYMGHLIGCEVISEGVESESQLNVLRDHKCDYIQGFVWSKPVAYKAAVEMTK